MLEFSKEGPHIKRWMQSWKAPQTREIKQVFKWIHPLTVIIDNEKEVSGSHAVWAASWGSAGFQSAPRSARRTPARRRWSVLEGGFCTRPNSCFRETGARGSDTACFCGDKIQISAGPYRGASLFNNNHTAPESYKSICMKSKQIITKSNLKRL